MSNVTYRPITVADVVLVPAVTAVKLIAPDKVLQYSVPLVLGGNFLIYGALGYYGLSNQNLLAGLLVGAIGVYAGMAYGWEKGI